MENKKIVGNAAFSTEELYIMIVSLTETKRALNQLIDEKSNKKGKTEEEWKEITFSADYIIKIELILSKMEKIQKKSLEIKNNL